MEDRTWAKGLDQFTFEREFVKRRPWTDVIPDVTLWAYEEEPKYHGIDGVNPADMIDAESIQMETVKVELKEPENLPEHLKKKEGHYACRGCGRLFDYPIARAGHERKCKMIVKEATNANS